MHVEVSWWLLGVAAALVGPLLLRVYVRRAEQAAARRTLRILARARDDLAGRKSEPPEGDPG